MIAKLKGIIDETGADFVVLDVNGVGYHIACSARTLAALPGEGEAAIIFTDMLVSENAIRLVGFSSAAERDWFRLLDGVQGVGTKVALAVLSTLSVSELAQAIVLGDKAMVARAQGVGPKVAQRIVTELKDKGPAISAADIGLAHVKGPAAAFSGPAAEAVSALLNLGYGQVQANAAVATAQREAGEGATTEKLIRFGLKELAR